MLLLVLLPSTLALNIGASPHAIDVSASRGETIHGTITVYGTEEEIVPISARSSASFIFLRYDHLVHHIGEIEYEITTDLQPGIYHEKIYIISEGEGIDVAVSVPLTITIEKTFQRNYIAPFAIGLVGYLALMELLRRSIQRYKNRKQ